MYQLSCCIHSSGSWFDFLSTRISMSQKIWLHTFTVVPNCFIKNICYWILIRSTIYIIKAYSHTKWEKAAYTRYYFLLALQIFLFLCIDQNEIFFVPLNFDVVLSYSVLMIHRPHEFDILWHGKKYCPLSFQVIKQVRNNRGLGWKIDKFDILD